MKERQEGTKMQVDFAKDYGAKCQASWDRSQIGNEEEDEEVVWQEENQMVLQWAEDEKLEEILEQRRREGSALKADVMKNTPELVVHERMAHGEKVTGAKGCRESLVGCGVVGGRLREGVASSRRRRNYAQVLYLVGKMKKMREGRWRKCINKE